MSPRNTLRQDEARKALAAPGERRPGLAGGAGQTRHSNGLKDFLWLLPDSAHGRILDLAPVSQQTIDFFTARGFRVCTENLLREWLEHRAAAEAAASKESAEQEKPSLGEIAAGFLASNLVFPQESFEGILAWDLVDYLDGELLAGVVVRLYALLKPKGVLLAAFHSSRADRFQQYRVLDQETVEVVPAGTEPAIQRVLQNREILNLFSRFQSSRIYVGRDQLREGLFMK
jgi:hypothetical protein